MMKNKKIIIPLIIALSAAAFLSVAVLALAIFLPVKQYLDETPEITVNRTVSAFSGETLNVDDLCQIECKGNYTTQIKIMDSSITDVAVSDDEQSIYVGSTSGVIEVSIVARGENAESRSAAAKILVDMD